MKNLNEKRFITRFGAFMTAMTLSTANVFAANEFANVVKPIISLLNSFMAPLLAIVVAVGSLYCILLGVKFAKAEEPQDREKAKAHLKNAIIGFILIFVLIVLLNLLVPVMENWVNSTLKSNGGSTIF